MHLNKNYNRASTRVEERKGQVVNLKLFIFIYICLVITSMHSEEIMNKKIKRTVLLLPVQNLTAKEEFESLAFTIYKKPFSIAKLRAKIKSILMQQ